MPKNKIREIRASDLMGNTCIGPNLTKNAFFESVSATIWRSRSENESLLPASGTGSIKDSSAVATDAPNPVKIDGIDSKPSKAPEVVGNPAPANPSKKPTQVKRIKCSVGLQAGFVFKLKTENLKEIYNLGRKLGQGQFDTTVLCVEKATGKVYACKSILKRNLVTEDDIEDVRKEIQITAPLVWPPQCHLHQRGLRRRSGSPFGHGVVRRWGALR